MARLTPEQWLAARADFEIAGLSVSEIARKYNVAKSSVSDKAKTQGWESNKTERSVSEKSNAIIALAKVNQETEQKLNNVERAVFDRVVADDVAFRLQNDADMEAVREHAMSLLPLVEKPAEAKALMETLRIQREARLGKVPDTMVQVNNNAPVELEPRTASQKIAGILAVAQERKDAAKRD
nr:MAG TPA: helix-turn-helix, Psq domain [Caudoviricetes sp.]